MKDSNDYPYIRAWCRLMHSADYYLLGELRRARAEDAPKDAIYSTDEDEGWATVTSVKSAETRTLLDRFVAEARA